jgi:hypothetical protein
MSFVSLLWILFVMDVLGMAFPNMFAYIFLGNQLLQATLCSCFALSREYLKLSRISIYLSMAFISYHLPYAYVLWIWSWIYLCNPPPRNISIHYLTYQVIIIFVVNILIIFTLALALKLPYLIAKDLFWSNSHLSSSYLLDPLLLYLKFVLCFLELGKAMIQFLCIDIQKSYFLIMHYSLGSYPTLSRTSFFKLVLYLIAFLEHD